jgi:Cu(I)/Ag(I) efflux system membrane fusion protein
MPAGVLSRVRLRPGQVAQAGIRTVEVRFAHLEERLITAGLVGFDEGRRVLVASDARGRLRVDRLRVSAEGEPVRAGQPLAELYGFDVSQAIHVFIEARGTLHDKPGTPTDPQRTPLGDPEERIRLAVQGLKVLGVREDQIDAIAAGAGSGDRLPLLAPIDGHVVRKEVHEGQYVAEGMVLFEVADLRRVSVDAGVFEDQLGRVEVGRSVEATVPAFPELVFRGRVGRIAPTVDPATRTVAVRFELDNGDQRLRPGMFATVTLTLATRGRPARERQTCPVSGLRLGSMGPAIRVDVGGRTAWVCCSGCIPKLESAPDKYLAVPGATAGSAVLCVPESAVIDTGASRVVYVESAPGVFEGRAVTLGPRSGDSYPVLDGLVPGERVAAAGAFLIDAETRINPSTRGTPAPGVGDRGTGERNRPKDASGRPAE